MLHDTLQHLREVLESDPIIQDNLSRYENEDENGDTVSELAFAFMQAPQDMRMPYMVVNAQPASDTNPSLNSFIYTVDVYTDNGDFLTAQLITDKVESLLHARRLPVEFAIGAWREARYIIPNEDDPSIQHHFVSFIVRHNRLF